MKVIVTRAFYLSGEVQPVGTELEVADIFGRELIYNGKAAKSAPKPEAAPVVEADADAATDAAPTPKKGKAK